MVARPKYASKSKTDLPRRFDTDVVNARWLSNELQRIANALDSDDAANFAGWRPLVKKMVKVYQDLDDARPTVADNKHKAFLIAALRFQGKLVCKGADISEAVNVCLRVMKLNLPEYSQRLDKHRALVEAVLRSYRSNVGGRGQRVTDGGRPALIAELCQVIGWSGSTAAIRQARARKKKKLVTD